MKVYTLYLMPEVKRLFEQTVIPSFYASKRDCTLHCSSLHQDGAFLLAKVLPRDEHWKSSDPFAEDDEETEFEVQIPYQFVLCIASVDSRKVPGFSVKHRGGRTSRQTSR